MTDVAQVLTQHSQYVLQPENQFLAVHHDIAVLDRLQGMSYTEITYEFVAFREHTPRRITKWPDVPILSRHVEVL